MKVLVLGAVFVLNAVQAWYPCAPCEYDYQCMGGFGIAYCTVATEVPIPGGQVQEYQDYQQSYSGQNHPERNQRRRGRPSMSDEELGLCILESAFHVNPNDPQKQKRCQMETWFVIPVAGLCVLVTCLTLFCCLLRILRKVICCVFNPCGLLGSCYQSPQTEANSTRRGDLVMFRT
eukprot:maker-scaffold275_size226830-snap-gene-1.22 protein:Tk00629 transcript:maker-scaffold275_size226830-snap-gene-1.22-mRNA-1 annotation:"---NA---"